MSDTGKTPSYETVLRRMDLQRKMLNAMRTDSGADMSLRDVTVNGRKFRAVAMNDRITYADIVQMWVDHHRTDKVIEDSEESFTVTYYRKGRGLAGRGYTLAPGATMTLFGGETFTVAKPGGA